MDNPLNFIFLSLLSANPSSSSYFLQNYSTIEWAVVLIPLGIYFILFICFSILAQKSFIPYLSVACVFFISIGIILFDFYASKQIPKSQFQEILYHANKCELTLIKNKIENESKINMKLLYQTVKQCEDANSPLDSIELIDTLLQEKKNH